MRGSLSSDIQSQRSGFEAQGAAIKVFEMNITNDWMSAVLTLKCSTIILVNEQNSIQDGLSIPK